MPCYIIDDCEDEDHTEQTSNTEDENDCNDCSPFCICSSALGFTINTLNTFLAPVKLYSLPTYSEYNISSKSEYHSSLFRPPRVA